MSRKKGKFERPRDPAPTQAQRYAEPDRRKLSAAAIVSIVAGCLVAALVLGVFLYGTILKNGNDIYPNVYVAGVNVGGMDRLQAVDAIRDAVREAYDSESLDVRLPDRTLSFQPEQTGVALDVNEVIEQALAYGRGSNAFTAVSGYLKARKTDYSLDLQTALELDTDYIRRMIEQVASEVEREAVPSQVEYDADEKVLSVYVGTSARRLDTEGLYDAVYEAFMTGKFEPLAWDYEYTPVELLDLTPYYEYYCTEMANAAYDEETHTISEAVTGYGFDLQAASQKLATAAEGSELSFHLQQIDPEITAEELEEEMFGTVLFTTSTAYVNNPGRTRNLELACEAINGTVLNPGEVFSFNGIVGERTEEKGYQGATVYVEGGASAEELGGGVCQVASTIYYATLHLDLEQVWREPHMYKVDYVPFGMDATVYWGQIDYRFRNSLSHPMRIEANIDGGSVNITFYGVQETTNYVEMSYEILETIPWEEVEEVDETKPVGYREQAESPYTGYKVVTYKAIYDEDGNLLSKKEEAKSNYKKRDKKFIVGPNPNAELPVVPEQPDVPADDDGLIRDPGDVFEDYDPGIGYWP